MIKLKKFKSSCVTAVILSMCLMTAGCARNSTTDSTNNNENTITTTSISMESENASTISESLTDTVEITKLEAEQRRKIQDEKEYKKLKPELDNAIKKYSEAMSLAKFCSDKIKNATAAVNKVLTESGELKDLDIKENN